LRQWLLGGQVIKEGREQQAGLAVCCVLWHLGLGLAKPPPPRPSVFGVSSAASPPPCPRCFVFQSAVRPASG
jgi:hypothetical protein